MPPAMPPAMSAKSHMNETTATRSMNGRSTNLRCIVL
jgi:hypothetical protein